MDTERPRAPTETLLVCCVAGEHTTTGGYHVLHQKALRHTRPGSRSLGPSFVGGSRAGAATRLPASERQFAESIPCPAAGAERFAGAEPHGAADVKGVPTASI